MINLYQVLGVSSSASPAEIKAAFKRLAIQYHPDKNAGSAAAEEQFKTINHAYQILINPASREDYDLLRQYGHQTNTSQQQEPSTGRHRDKYYQRKGKTYQQKQQKHSQHSQQQNYTRKKTKPTPPMSKWETFVWIVFGLFGSFVLFIVVKTGMDHYDTRLSYQEAEHAYYIDNRISTATNLLSGAISRDDEYAEAYLLYGKIIMEKGGDAEHAIRLLNQGIILSDEVNSDYQLYLADAYHKAGQRREAYYAYKKVIELIPEHQHAHYQLGELALYYRQNYQEAIGHFDQVLALDHKHQQAHLHKGIALYKERQYEASQASLNTAVNLDPLDGVAFYYIGINDLEFYRDTVNACHLWLYAKDLKVVESNFYLRQYCVSTDSIVNQE